MVLASCLNSTKVDYHINTDVVNNAPHFLMNWEVCGPFSDNECNAVVDSLLKGYVNFNDILYSDYDTIPFRNGIYEPLYNNFDLREYYGIEPTDTSYITKNAFTLIKCNIESDKDSCMYLDINTKMPISIWLNGESLVRRNLQEQNIFKMHLKKGNNELMIQLSMSDKNISMDAQICDSLHIAQLYVERQSGKIIYPLISRHSKTITLTDYHSNILDTTAFISFYDVFGKNIYKNKLNKDSLRYVIDDIEPNHSYMCELRIGDYYTRQPVCCSNADDSYDRLSKLIGEIDNDSVKISADQLLYRFKFLLDHPSRNDGDWWWQFKIAHLCYELDYLYTHQDSNDNNEGIETNIQFVTYRSELDDGFQRYILARPNEISTDKPLPLVVVVRPDIEIHRHFFSSPQISRQWALNNLQALSDKYGYLVLIPEMRTYTNEELTPMAESELLLAIDDVRTKYKIDKDRIYLHANCSGSFRALTFAERHPDMFAAIALYAPLYDKKDVKSKENAPATHINNIRGIPIILHYDPLDIHSPIGTLNKLVDDCKREKIPLTISVKRNSDKLYNVLLVGEEAFMFFKNKSRNHLNEDTVKKDLFPNSYSISDFYKAPFVYVYNPSIKTESYISFVDSIRQEYENWFFSPLPLIEDTSMTESVIKTKNIFFIGDHFTNSRLTNMIKKSYNNKLERSENKEQIYMNINKNDIYKDKYFILYNSSSHDRLSHTIKQPWTIFYANVSSFSLDIYNNN